MKLKMLAASFLVASLMCCDVDGQLLSRLTNRCANDCGTSCCDAAPVCNTGCNSGCGISISLDINFQLPKLLRGRRGRGCNSGCAPACGPAPCAASPCGNTGCGPAPCDTGCGNGGGCNLLSRFGNRNRGCGSACDMGCAAPVASCGGGCDMGCGAPAPCGGGCDMGCGCDDGCGGRGRMRGLFQRRGFLTRLCNGGGGCGGCDAGCSQVVDSCGGCAAAAPVLQRQFAIQVVAQVVILDAAVTRDQDCCNVCVNAAVSELPLVRHVCAAAVVIPVVTQVAIPDAAQVVARS